MRGFKPGSFGSDHALQIMPQSTAKFAEFQFFDV